MGSRERPLFDLNELPSEEDEGTDGVSCFQPQRAIPSSSTHASDLFAAAPGPQTTVNNHGFSHASVVSGFQPFVRPKGAPGSLSVYNEKTRDGDMSYRVASKCKSTIGQDTKATPTIYLDSAEVQAPEKEEGEWSDAEGSVDAYASSSIVEQSLTGNSRQSLEKGMGRMTDHCDPGVDADNVTRNNDNRKDENCNHTSLGLDLDNNDRKSNISRNSGGYCEGDTSMVWQEESGLAPKQREVKGVEASHALKCANNLGKRPRFDQHKEVMLGKKRSRQTMFLNLEDVKQAGPIKTSTPRRQNFPAPITIRTVKEVRTVPPAEQSGENQSQQMNNKDSKQGF